MGMIMFFVAVCLFGLAAFVIHNVVRVYNTRHDQSDDQLSQRMIELSGFVKLNAPQG